MKRESFCDLSDSQPIDPKEEGGLGEAHLMREKIEEPLAGRDDEDEDEESQERGKQEVHDLIRERVTFHDEQEKESPGDEGTEEEEEET